MCPDSSIFVRTAQNMSKQRRLHTFLVFRERYLRVFFIQKIFECHPEHLGFLGPCLIHVGRIYECMMRISIVHANVHDPWSSYMYVWCIYLCSLILHPDACMYKAHIFDPGAWSWSMHMHISIILDPWSWYMHVSMLLDPSYKNVWCTNLELFMDLVCSTFW